MNRTRLRKLAAPAALVLGLGGAATALEVAGASISDISAQDAAPQAPLASAPAAANNLASAFRAATKATMPGVVYVEVEAAPRAVSNQANPFRGTPFEDFFRGAPGQAPSVPRTGSGSGFIISPEGYVLTNNHVVDGASRVTVTLTDNRQLEAEVVGRDPNTDVAVLKINADNLPVVPLGDADALEIGDWVLALGYPLSLGETATAGIVSAKGRSINILGRNEDATAPLEHFIQTDAAINPGNSGGPLIDLQGRVVGINTAIASPTGFYSGYGFAVPINLAKRIADDLIRDGVVHRPRLGVQIADVSPADVEVFRLPDASGAVVKGVQDGPAEDAGIQLGDVIVAVDGQEVEDTGELMALVARRQPGERIALDLIRYGDRERVALRLGEFETEPVERRASSAEPTDAVGRLGFAAVEVTPQIARRYELPFTDGVMVTEVDPRGSAPPQLRGMRIDRLNGREIGSVQDLRAAAEGLEPGATVSIIGRTPDGAQTIVNYKIR